MTPSSHSFRPGSAAPADVGVDPAGIDRFVHAATERGIDLHSLVIVRHGRVCAESYWHPYTAGGLQLFYSLSKSFTATAVGLAIGEGRFGLDDLVAELLDGRAAYGLGAGMDQVRVRHLLSMASGHDEDTITAMMASDDPVATVLAQPLAAPPGTLFTYNQGCTYLLSAILQAHSGLQLSDYLRPRLFEPLGIGDIFWRQTGGLDQGFSGLHARTRDAAALGQLHLQDGRWGDRQLLPPGWVSQATSAHVDTRERKDDPDWQQGYGFQFWRCRPDCYRGDGAFGQFLVVVPWADLVIAATSQTERMQLVLDLMWEHLLPAADPPSTPAGTDATPTASRPASAPWSADIHVPAPIGGQTPTAQADGTWTFTAEPAPYVDLETVRVDVGGVTSVDVHWRTGERVSFDVEPHWRPFTWGRVNVPGRRSLLRQQCLVAGGWLDEDTFAADVIFIETPHRLTLTCRVSTARADVQWWTVPL